MSTKKIDGKRYAWLTVDELMALLTDLQPDNLIMIDADNLALGVWRVDGDLAFCDCVIDMVTGNFWPVGGFGDEHEQKRIDVADG